MRRVAVGAPRRWPGRVLGALFDSLRLAEEVVEVAEAAPGEDALPAHAAEALAQKLRRSTSTSSRAAKSACPPSVALGTKPCPSQMSIASPRPVPAAMTATLAPRFFGTPAPSLRKCSLRGGTRSAPSDERDEVVEERDPLDAELAPDEPRVDDPGQVGRHDPPADDGPGDPEGRRGHLRPRRDLAEELAKRRPRARGTRGWRTPSGRTARPLGWSSDRRAWVPPMSPTSNTLFPVSRLRAEHPHGRDAERDPERRRAVNDSPNSHGAASAPRATPPPRTTIPVDATGPPRRKAPKRSTLENEIARPAAPRRAGRRAWSGCGRRACPARSCRDPERGGRLEDERAQPVFDAARRRAHEEKVHRDGHGARQRRRDPRGHADGHTTPSRPPAQAGERGRTRKSSEDSGGVSRRSPHRFRAAFPGPVAAVVPGHPLPRRGQPRQPRRDAPSSRGTPPTLVKFVSLHSILWAGAGFRGATGSRGLERGRRHGEC